MADQNTPGTRKRWWDAPPSGDLGKATIPLVTIGIVLTLLVSNPLGIAVMVVGIALGIYAAMRPDTDWLGRPKS